MTTIAQDITGWRSDIRIMERANIHQTAVLCYAYNWATNPASLRTDREHSACRRFAAWCRKRLKGRTHWFESESGRLMPMGGSAASLTRRS